MDLPRHSPMQQTCSQVLCADLEPHVKNNAHICAGHGAYRHEVDEVLTIGPRIQVPNSNQRTSQNIRTINKSVSYYLQTISLRYSDHEGFVILEYPRPTE